jgi:hypothetical protein
MHFDRRPRAAVAPIVVAAALAACGPAVRPEAVGVDPGPPPEPMGPKRTAHGRSVLLGEMCPLAAAGRPGVAPLAVRGVEWSSDPAAVGEPIARTTVGKFAVLGYDGARAGVFESLGAADAGLPQDVAAGTYVGASPCTRDAGKGARAEDVGCNAATKGCGLALAEVGRGDDPPPALEPGGGCMAGDFLVVDVDADGRLEAFPITDFLDGVRAPVEEVSAAPVAPTSTCAPRFSIYGLKLAPGIDPGAPVDPKYQVNLDVLGIADLDGDGRREVAIALRYPESRTVVLYSATRAAGRLDLVGESVSWPLP